MDIEKIERYLNGQMEPSEEESFESQMKKWPSLEDDVRTMAYIIHSIKDVAIEKENERIDRIKLSTHTDRKRYITAVAALFLAIAMVTGSIATGLYFLLKDKEEGTKQTTQSEFKAPVKIEGNPLQLPKAQNEEKSTKEKEETNKERKENKTSTPAVTSDEPVVKDDVSTQEQEERSESQEREENQPAPIQKQLKPRQLPENYEMNDIHIQKVGDEMICSFTMTNTKETAKVSIHTPRAIDIYGKNYSTLYCKINKTNKLETSWEKGKAYKIVISIYCLNEKITFKQISFSFQSKGKYVKTNSMSIKLE